MPKKHIDWERVGVISFLLIFNIGEWLSFLYYDFQDETLKPIICFGLILTTFIVFIGCCYYPFYYHNGGDKKK